MGLFCLRNFCLRRTAKTEVCRVVDCDQDEASQATISAPSQKAMCERGTDGIANDEAILLCTKLAVQNQEVVDASHGRPTVNEQTEHVPGACPATTEGKALRQLPDFGSSERLVGAVFVHGNGDCDQLGLGSDVFERKKPALVPGLSGVSIRSIACGGMHTLCLSADGRLFSWGCGDDEALGRSSGSDCEPGLVEFPENVTVLSVSCGDSHSCCIDSMHRGWLWGSYKDSSGYIGISPPGIMKMQDGLKISEKRCEPAVICGLDDVIGLCSGANHSIALTAAGQVYTWGSNQTGQLGLPSGVGCEVFEETIDVADTDDDTFVNAEGGGVLALRCRNSKAGQVIRVQQQDGIQVNTRTMSLPFLQDLIAKGAKALVLEVTDRKVSLTEKQTLLFPQRLQNSNAKVIAVFASCECSFVVAQDGAVYGCGLNCHGQVGAGFISAGIWEMTQVPGVEHADWLGGGAHMSAALVRGQVLTWGRAEECGHGASTRWPPVLRPCIVERLPTIRNVRCGMSHTLACTEAGDVFAWGCGVSHQLGNRPRNCHDPHDARDEPTDEMLPYCLSSKILEDRFVLLADGGAQHSVELVWTSDLNLQDPIELVEEEPLAGDEYAEVDADAVELGADESQAGPELLRIETRYDFWRVQIESVYRRRNPYKLQNVPDLLKKYEGQEAVLYTKVCRKYDLDPSKFYADPRSWEGEEEDVKPDADDQIASANVAAVHDTGADAQPALFIFGQPDGSSDTHTVPVANHADGGVFGSHPSNITHEGPTEEISDSEEINTDCSKKKVRGKKRIRGKVSQDDSEDSEEAYSEKKTSKGKGKKIIKESNKFKKAKPHSKAA
eukprot:gnl/MRDRNA2_/MRDRNA2_103062_c0_seq1.p1 gnl/MRDRNA2_/MRDRNA2_103062_c0~~gnl/MRDRNA2_/MRDRNA2_103062_c0_seq1.p1  ORF type:complete len:838 (+),score=158.99 gnl/MRDRNA2_/MRDRNA2_103062_c0_seq1:110-2623(+)